MALDFVSANEPRWHTRTFDYFQLWPSILSRDDVTHHARTILPTPYLPHMTSLSNRHVWRHKWWKAIFGFCFRKWRWVKYLKCCQYGLSRLIKFRNFIMCSLLIMKRIRTIIMGHLFNFIHSDDEFSDN